MAFGIRLGQLIRRRREIEQLTQEELAHLVYGTSTRKNDVSKLENGHVPNPQSKTVDLFAVALNIDEDEIESLRSGKPPPNMVDTLVDFFDTSARGKLYVEVAVKDSGEVVIFYDCPLKVELLRLEFFVEDQQLVWVTKGHNRRTFGMMVREAVARHIPKVSKVYFVRMLDEDRFGEPLEIPLLVVG